MNIYLLNLPHPRNIIRKYSCSYYSNGFLYPPLELVRVANIIQKYSAAPHQLRMLDAIAEKRDLAYCLNDMEEFTPDMIITLASVDFFNEEYRAICKIKEVIPAQLICIGYLPDMFSDKYSAPDLSLGKDFEGVFQQAFASCSGSDPDEYTLKLLHYKNQPPPFDADILERTDLSLLNPKHYFEFQTRGKTAFTYFSFGCPFRCTFCIRTYNLDTVYYRNQELIFSELLVYRDQGIRNVRIMDDNIPVKKSFLIALLDFLKENDLHFSFYGLSRIDLLDEETILLLKEIGFRRILIGLETINPKLQSEYRKTIAFGVEEISRRIRFIHEQKIRTVAFILYNPLKETRDDILQALSFLKKLPVDYASISQILPYPGTDFFQINRDEIELTFEPGYESRFKQSENAISRLAEYHFFLSFYVFNKFRLFRTLSWLFLYPSQSLGVFLNFFRFLWRRSGERKDFF